MKSKVISVCNSIDLDAVGFTSADVYNKTSGENYKTAIVVLFPYYCGEKENSNISKYTHGKDYHKIVLEKLNFVATELGLDDYKVFADTGPEIDRTLALNAGLCFKGLNHMCINDKYGSYFFIGYIVCKIDVPFDKPLNKSCKKCGLCISKCPGNALENGFCYEKCLSYITQKKGQLSPLEEKLLKEGKSIFGCDICQDACPHNKEIAVTPLKEFKTDLITKLKISDIENLSNREFKEKYGDRAFSWRGKQVILRNLIIKEHR